MSFGIWLGTGQGDKFLCLFIQYIMRMNFWYGRAWMPKMFLISSPKSESLRKRVKNTMINWKNELN